jgi:succinate dehydrogenase hydrophobic anchor subunit
MWDLQRLTTVWASMTCYRDSFTLLRIQSINFEVKSYWIAHEITNVKTLDADVSVSLVLILNDVYHHAGRFHAEYSLGKKCGASRTQSLHSGRLDLWSTDILLFLLLFILFFWTNVEIKFVEYNLKDFCSHHVCTCRLTDVSYLLRATFHRGVCLQFVISYYHQTKVQRILFTIIQRLCRFHLTSSLVFHVVISDSCN